MAETAQGLAERVDDAMRQHARSHAISNSPNSFYCNPQCVSENLRMVVVRELADWASPTDTRAKEGEAWNEGFNAGFEIGGCAARREPTPNYQNPYLTTAPSPPEPLPGERGEGSVQ